MSNSFILLFLKFFGIFSWGLWIKFVKNVLFGMFVLFIYVRKLVVILWLMMYFIIFLFKVMWIEFLIGWIVWGGFLVIFYFFLFVLIWWMLNWSKWINGWIIIKDCDCMVIFCKWKVLYSYYFIVFSWNLFYVILCIYYKNFVNFLMVFFLLLELLKICNIFISL